MDYCYNVFIRLELHSMFVLVNGLGKQASLNSRLVAGDRAKLPISRLLKSIWKKRRGVGCGDQRWSGLVS